jgi:DNA-binding NarL/FixJ family response regulator
VSVRTFAQDAVERFAPEAVLLDVRLGGDDGFEVCRRLTRSRPGLPVLLASTGDYDQCDELVASSGARGFVSKTRLSDTDFGQFWPRAYSNARGDAGAALRGAGRGLAGAEGAT